MTGAAAGMPLQAWFSDWLRTTDKELIYRKAAERQVLFVRDELRSALADSHGQWKGAVTVIGEHRSKSVPLPVYRIALPGLDLVLRDNFYNWKVSVRSDKPIEEAAGWGLFDEADRSRIGAVYCEGFPGNWVFGPYAENNKRFTAELYSECAVWAFCLLVRGKR